MSAITLCRRPTCRNLPKHRTGAVSRIGMQVAKAHVDRHRLVNFGKGDLALSVAQISGK